VLILMHSCSELIQLPSDCHERILHKCTMSTIQSLCCTCSKWNEIVGCASQYDHRLWRICVTLQKSAPAFAGHCVQPTQPMSLYCMHLPILPNVPSCLHHLIPEECVEAFYVHTYIWHCSPPDLEWAAHEVRRMVRNEVARNPLGFLGVRGYFKALQKDCKQMQQQPYVPHTEATQWSGMRKYILLPAVQAVCAILENYSNIYREDEPFLHEFAALRSEVFGWVDFICVNLNVMCDDSTKHQQKPQFRARWPITALSRRLRAAIKSPFK
jgi:hypothetical protein